MMDCQVHNTQKKKRTADAHRVPGSLRETEPSLYFRDNRSDSPGLNTLQTRQHKSLQHQKTAEYQAMAARHSATRQQPVQKKVAQRITYKSVEYSSRLGNLKIFHTIAGGDLDLLDNKRDKNRDKKMLNVLGNSDYDVTSPEVLLNLIHPAKKGYQQAIDQEFKVLRPVIRKMHDLAAEAHDMVPVLRNDDSTESHEFVIMNMVDVKEKNDTVKTQIQWKKTEGINPLADQVIEAAEYSMDSVLEYVDPEHPKSKKQQQVQEKKLNSGEGIMDRNTTSIAETAKSIEPEIRQSGDEQYLRGTVGAKGDLIGGSHINIGKKTATKPLLEENPEEAKGILWASVWSQGVNNAFIEGGTDAAHEFRLISPLPVELEPPLREGNIPLFKTTAKEGAVQHGGKDPWRAYYHLGNDDLTTLGKEIVQLLHAGYVLE